MILKIKCVKMCFKLSICVKLVIYGICIDDNDLTEALYSALDVTGHVTDYFLKVVNFWNE